MKVLILSLQRDNLKKILEACGDEVTQMKGSMDTRPRIDLTGFDYVITYGYPFLLSESVVEMFRGRAINLHISLLPWNKGADPNLWSFLEDTPKGVTIHLIDKSFDTGGILAQKEVIMDIERETLRSSFLKLLDTIEELFMRNWELLKAQRLQPVAQLGKGSLHRTQDKEKYRHIMPLGWDTPVKDLVGIAKKCPDYCSEDLAVLNLNMRDYLERRE